MTKTFGAQNEHGILKRVLMHRPGDELSLIDPSTLDFFGFSSPVDPLVFIKEFDALSSALSSLGTEVILLENLLKNDQEALNYIRCRPNMTYTRDLAVVLDKGILLMSMFHKGRKGDTWIIRRAAERLGIPVLGEIQPPGFVEGGGITFLSERQLIVSLCDRTTEPAIYQMCDLLLGEHVDEIIMVPVAEGEVHIDGLLMFVGPNLSIGYKPYLELYPATIFRKDQSPRYVWLPEYLSNHGFDLFEVTEEEKNRACVNCVTVAPLTTVGFDWANRIEDEIIRRGGNVIGIPGDQLIRGNAGPHCMTCPILKE